MDIYPNNSFISSSYPNEKTKSASSTTSIAKSSLSLRLFVFRCAKALDGVVTTISGLSDNNDFCICISPFDDISMHLTSLAHFNVRSLITEAI